MLMKKKVMALIAVIGLAMVPLQAEQMKCGAGKCGAAMQKDMKGSACHCEGNCDHENCAHMKDASKPCDCNSKKPAKIKCGGGMKCGAGKCGK